jgi:uncharacterized membrane protein
MADVPGWAWLLVGGLVSGLIVLGFARSMPQRTSLGAQERRTWEAFRNYLQDLTRYQDMATARETFERYLPYAIAFGVERDWVRRFEQLKLPAPVWYHPMWVPDTSTGPVAADSGGMPAGVPVGMPTGMPGGLGGLSLDSISDGLFNSLNSVSNVLTSKPSSSGSGRGAWGGGGGGFGGGFSGGGGGGGFRAG